MLLLHLTLQAMLLGQPESGKGYQMVEVVTAEQKVKRGIAYNAELLVFEEEPRLTLKTSDYEQLLKEARSSAGKITSVRVLTNTVSSPPSPASKETVEKHAPKSVPAKDAPVEKLTEEAVFKRFSAYANDRRVTADGRLLPGTYATTAPDAGNVRTGKEAVARYALPNPKPASNVFTIKPRKGTLVQRGIVQPAYHEPGGGVEIIFTEGTQPGTVTGPEKVPDD